uniref:DUF4371 domain-containing protein n=1 Tax=Chromera velia CCMP2878 TaxID=1169474 RepID=A0A0G4H776_9ALVE|eukprot:Cvel_5793.t1-p1 / transcript=Cvel_5793.t1 / gene=Cvel_5793 / organism=Chromera_velia_CCMP2878 / gene_product=hypothetical protein / transcript_product=hypothetical protein / location=Cvel_scaffold275:53211-70964(-) / protein_length=734 / sequence_SO=supercontig / SO=protein_coding / is_pseudo=false
MSMVRRAWKSHLRAHIENLRSRGAHLLEKFIDKSAAQQITVAILEAIIKRLVTLLGSVPFFLMTIDGSNDRTSESNVIVFVEFLHPKSFKWEVKFWELSGVEGQSARCVKDSFFDSLRRYGVDMKRCIAGGSDNCSTMKGWKGRFGAPMRKEPEVLICFEDVFDPTHQLQLCPKDVASQSLLCQEVEKFLISSATLIRSGARVCREYLSKEFIDEMEDVFDDFDEVVFRKNPTMLLRLAAARWLSHGGTSHRLLKNYPYVLRLADVVMDNREFVKWGGGWFEKVLAFSASTAERQPAFESDLPSDHPVLYPPLRFGRAGKGLLPPFPHKKRQKASAGHYDNRCPHSNPLVVQPVRFKGGGGLQLGRNFGGYRADLDGVCKERDGLAQGRLEAENEKVSDKEVTVGKKEKGGGKEKERSEEGKKERGEEGEKERAEEEEKERHEEGEKERVEEGEKERVEEGEKERAEEGEKERREEGEKERVEEGEKERGEEGEKERGEEGKKERGEGDDALADESDDMSESDFSSSEGDFEENEGGGVEEKEGGEPRVDPHVEKKQEDKAGTDVLERSMFSSVIAVAKEVRLLVRGEARSGMRTREQTRTQGRIRDVFSLILVFSSLKRRLDVKDLKKILVDYYGESFKNINLALENILRGAGLGAGGFLEEGQDKGMRDEELKNCQMLFGGPALKSLARVAKEMRQAEREPTDLLNHICRGNKALDESMKVCNTCKEEGKPT